MKKIYTLITFLMAFNGMLFSQEKRPIFTYDSLRKIELNHRFISMNENLEHLPFSTIAIDSLSIDSINYVIHVGRFQDWENEPGDFDIIQFYQKGKTILTYKDASGIVKLNQRKNHYAYPFYPYSNNGYFITQDMTNGNKILLFIGQHYGSDHAKLIIFIVTPKEVQLVYNLSGTILDIQKNKENIHLIIQSNRPDDGKSIIKHSIYTEEGKLIFKDLSE